MGKHFIFQRFRWAYCISIALLLDVWVADVTFAKDSEPTPEELLEGERLAATLRSLPPAADLRLNGRLNIRDGSGNIREVPFLFQATVTPTNWTSTYRSKGVGTSPMGEHVSVAHRTDHANTYWSASDPFPDVWQLLVGGAETRSFAGSDFSLADLGLEFLHWPGQRILRIEMRKSRSCHVLESSRPSFKAGEYRRIISWIDVESGGLYVAEAYDDQNKLLKEFNVNNMAKIDGRWQIKQMEIRNVRTKSRTRLDFEVK